MRHLSITMAVVAALFVSSLAMAQQNNHAAYVHQGPGGGMMGMYAGLSAEDQASLKALQDEHWKRILPLTMELRAKRAELDSLLVASKLDKGKVSSLNKEINELHGKIATEKTEFRRKVFELTGNLMGGNNGSGMSGMCGMKGKGGGSMSGMRMMMMPDGTETE